MSNETFDVRLSAHQINTLIASLRVLDSELHDLDSETVSELIDMLSNVETDVLNSFVD